MSVLRRNIAANLATRVWASVLGLIFPPIYARLLGIESYGLIGVWASLTTLLNILDLGLSATLNREIARYSTEPGTDAHRAMRDLTQTIAVVFWAVGIGAGLVIAAIAPVIAERWVNARGLSPHLVTSSIRLMGVVFAFQWPVGAYGGALLGLQKQVAANAVQSVLLTVRLVGAVAVLKVFGPSIVVFFFWQAGVMAAQTAATAIVLSKAIPGGGRGRFRWSVLADNWRFSSGMFLIAILSVVLSQADKIVVSRLLTLEQFGYYSLAWTVGGALLNLISPVFLAVFPRLSQLAKTEETAALTDVYHGSCRLLSVIVLPAAAALALFSREVLFAWSGDARIVAMASGVLVLVAIGTALNGLMTLPYALMLAYGWTRLYVIASFIAIPVVVSLEYVLTKHYGGVGAAVGWVVLNAAFVVVVVPLMHNRILRGEHWRWYLSDVGLPLVGVVAVALPARLLFLAFSGRVADAVLVVCITMVSTAAAGVIHPEFRRQALTLLAGLSTMAGRSAGKDGPSERSGVR